MTTGSDAPTPGPPPSPSARAVSWLAGRATIGEPLEVFRLIGADRRLWRTWLPFAGTMLLRSRLPRAEVELLILRTACNCASAYEWAQHAPLARRAGLAATTVSAIPGFPEAAHFSPRQVLLLEAADELHDRGVLAAGTSARLQAELDHNQLLNVCMIVGHYEMLAMALNTFGVRPEESALQGLEYSELTTAKVLESLCLRRRQPHDHPHAA